MKEKRDAFAKEKKGDEHPFVPYLFEDEKILWMDGSPLASRSPLKSYFSISFTCLILWFIVMSLSVGLPASVSTSALCLFLIAGLSPLILWTTAKKEAYPQRLYALTDRHLFCWDGSKVTERALEAVHPIGLVPGAGSQGTLSFGNGFPSWHNIDDAAYVKTMIEQAQRHRLEEHS